MQLPLRIVSEPDGAPVVSVDGAWGAPGLNLSHWPGNATPARLRHDLSTGVALAFARLDPEERAQLAAGCVAVANNHYDTDGVCSLFAVLRPEEALKRAELLLDVAAAGDFFQAPSERAVCIDAIVHGFADPLRSPIAGEFAGLSEVQRHERAARVLVERLPDILDGDLSEWRALWEPALAELRAGKLALAGSAHDDIVHLDWSVWTAPVAAADAPFFDPGRHALFGSTARDRVLAVGPRPDGASYRFVIGTLSWFDLAGAPRLARPDLAALALRLNAAEGRAPDGDPAWRAQSEQGPSPELWFGQAELEHFAEHNTALATSRLEPALVRREIADALRAALAIPLA